ncbi:uracil-DNA glycosylase [Herbaspirillum sp. ST 5-3]|uniref:uracil-DNA glycosylase n=1 Tax=Oxalobacteraceae TaxID=75682 RepID=UPI0010A4DD97|nr:uracil-DNA glycosylase [Herbaspirillum sp. ST 5-3]
MTGSAERRAVFLREIGVGPVWQRRAAVPPQQQPSTEFAVEMSQPAAFDDMPIDMPPLDLPETDKPAARDALVPEVSSMDWGQLQSTVAACTKCGLCTGRTKTVFGVGDEKAKWLFVGEGPGRNEDLRGEPFVGQAGKLLDNMLLAMGLKRGENAYIANIVKCRPTDETGRDRAPTAVETAACMPYLERQIALIQPTVIVALGKTAAISLLGLDAETPVSKLRGTVHRYADRPLVVTYHPAYLLRNMADKKKAWADICLAMTAYAGVR